MTSAGEESDRVPRSFWGRIRHGGALALLMPAAVVVGIVRGLGAMPQQWVADHPQGPIRASWEALRRPPKSGRLQRLNLYRRTLASIPEPLYPAFALVFAGGIGWFSLLMVEAGVTDVPKGVAVAVVVFVALVGGGAGAGLYQLAVARRRRDLSAAVNRWTRPDRAFAVGLAVFCPTIAFAAVTALLVRYDALAVEGARATDPNLTRQAFGAYLWYLADAVPLLKIPETLHWTPALRFPTWPGGTLALLYKLALILPAVHLFTLALTHVWDAEAPHAKRPG